MEVLSILGTRTSCKSLNRHSLILLVGSKAENMGMNVKITLVYKHTHSFLLTIIVQEYHKTGGLL